MNNEKLLPHALEELIKTKSCTVIDVRTPGEFNASHIPDSINLPLGSSALSDYKSKLKEADFVCIVCQGGTRARQCYTDFSSIKKDNLYILEGGINAWENAKKDVIKGQGAISMERQVRIAAGFLVGIGSILSILHNTSWIYLPMFIGAGLVFSGITNTCGMARVLARMPWNCGCGNSTCDTKK